MPKQKTIIVTRGFNQKDIIGKMWLAKGVKIPFNSVFSFGGIVRKKEGNEITEFELLEISLIPDSQYKKIKKHA